MQESRSLVSRFTRESIFTKQRIRAQTQVHISHGLGPPLRVRHDQGSLCPIPETTAVTFSVTGVLYCGLREIM